MLQCILLSFVIIIGNHHDSLTINCANDLYDHLSLCCCSQVVTQSGCFSWVHAPIWWLELSLQANAPNTPNLRMTWLLFCSTHIHRCEFSIRVCDSMVNMFWRPDVAVSSLHFSVAGLRARLYVAMQIASNSRARLASLSQGSYITDAALAAVLKELKTNPDCFPEHASRRTIKINQAC